MRRHIHSLEQEFQALGYEGVAFAFSDGHQPDKSPEQPYLPSSGADTYDMPEPEPEPKPAHRKPAVKTGLDLRL